MQSFTVSCSLINVNALKLFHYCDLELDPMTFISEADLDIVVTYLNAKNEDNRSNGSKVIIRTDTHTDRCE